MINSVQEIMLRQEMKDGWSQWLLAAATSKMSFWPIFQVFPSLETTAGNNWIYILQCCTVWNVKPWPKLSNYDLDQSGLIKKWKICN